MSTADERDEMGRGPLAVVTTSPYQVELFLGTHLQALPNDLEVLIYTNAHDQYAAMLGDRAVEHIPVSRAGRITRRDWRAVQQLRKSFRERSVKTVVSVSPKAGFVAQAAAITSGVPNRVHIFTGQVWAGLSGPRRVLVKAADRAVGRMATHLAADSPSQAQFLQDEGVAPHGHLVDVPHPPGSIRGVDLIRFRPQPDARVEFRNANSVDAKAFCFMQLGRLTHAKGIDDLVDAFARLRKDWVGGQLDREPCLFLVGPDEEGLAAELKTKDGVWVLPYTSHPQDLLAAMDVMVLASHREGFGSTIIEAGAVGLPSIGTDIVGVRDAITSSSGWLVPKETPQALYVTMRTALDSPDDVRRRGNRARERAVEEFDSAVVASAYANYLMRIHGGRA